MRATRVLLRTPMIKFLGKRPTNGEYDPDWVVGPRHRSVLCALKLPRPAPGYGETCLCDIQEWCGGAINKMANELRAWLLVTERFVWQLDWFQSNRDCAVLHHPCGAMMHVRMCWDCRDRHSHNMSITANLLRLWHHHQPKNFREFFFALLFSSLLSSSELTSLHSLYQQPPSEPTNTVKVDHTPRPHPLSPTGSLPPSFTAATIPLNKGSSSNYSPPGDGEFASRRELSKRFQYRPFSENEINEVNSGGAFF